MFRKLKASLEWAIIRDEAVENTIAHNDHEQPHVAVTVGKGSEADRIHVETADNDPRIPTDEWNVIFSGEETQLAHRSGISLWMMYWSITAVGGTIELMANEPRGSVITYQVPLGTTETSAD